VAFDWRRNAVSAWSSSPHFVGSLALLALCAFGTWLACIGLRRFALARALVDIPNARSLHSEPVPRIGGVAVCAGLALAALCAYVATGDPQLLIWLLLAVPVFAVGLVDDLRPVSARVRFALQGAVAVAYVAAAKPLTTLVIVASPETPLQIPIPSWISAPASVIWIVALINIYNFMDGMDGLAAVQSMGASLAFAVLLAGDQGALAFLALAVCCASFGFFLQNAPKAKIFLGDAGSTVLGFTFASLALVSAKSGKPFLAGPVALAPFLLDATFTLARRITRGERFWEAHRTHLYQRAVGSGLDHRRVLLRYAVWIGVAMVTAISLPALHVVGVVAATVSVALVLLIVHAWVRRREAIGAAKGARSTATDG
jgi:UDP-N-acetylmuramyl pentapeptide phosphotransferase/UDP-N-acetylglucosamine-1-phosphate transferase